MYDALLLVDRIYKGFLGRNEQLTAIGRSYYKEYVGGGIVDGNDTSQSSFFAVDNSKSDEVIAESGRVVRLYVVAFRVIDIEQGKCGGIGFIVYNRQGKIYWITKAPGSSSPPFSIHSDRWEKKYFLFRPSEENVQEITGFLTMVSLSPGSEIYMDDIWTKIIERPAAAGRDGSGR